MALLVRLLEMVDLLKEAYVAMDQQNSITMHLGNLADPGR
jgi:hypothetical protein